MDMNTLTLFCAPHLSRVQSARPISYLKQSNMYTHHNMTQHTTLIMWALRMWFWELGAQSSHLNLVFLELT